MEKTNAADKAEEEAIEFEMAEIMAELDQEKHQID